MLGVMSECPVLSAARYLVCCVLDRNYTAAWEWTDIRIAFFIEGHIPRGDRASPVVQDSVELVGPLGPVRLVIGRGDVRSTLGPIRVLRGERIMHAAHRCRFADVAVPGDSVNVFVCSGITEFINRAAP